MENVNHNNIDDDQFININEYNFLFNTHFGPKIYFDHKIYTFNKSVDSLDDLDYNSIFNSIQAISSKEENESLNNSIIDINKDNNYITEENRIKKTETIETSVNFDKKSCIGCFSKNNNYKKKRLKTLDSYYSTNVNNTKRSSNMSKSIKLNDSLTKFRKKKLGVSTTQPKTVHCGCNII